MMTGLSHLLVSLVVVFSVNTARGSGVSGWFTSENTTSTELNCLIGKNDAQYIIYSGHTGTSVTQNVCTNLQAAETAKIAHRDVKFAPCPTCSASAASQLNDMVSFINSKCKSAWTGRIWLDCDNSQIWSTPWQETGYKVNQNWFKSMVDACVAISGVTCGIKSSSSQWGYIFGSKTYTYDKANSLDLWYSSTNGVASFDDFIPFSGFAVPFSKSYQYSLTTCSPTPATGNFATYADWAPVYN